MGKSVLRFLSPAARFWKCLPIVAYIVFCGLAVCAYPFPAWADWGREMVYYDCQPNHSLYVKVFVLYDITPVLNEHTIWLDQLTDKQTRECQITPTDKAIVQIGVSRTHPRNNNVSVLVNKNGLGTATFDQKHAYTFVVTNNYNKADVAFIDAETNQKIRNTYLTTDGK